MNYLKTTPKTFSDLGNSWKYICNRLENLINAPISPCLKNYASEKIAKQIIGLAEQLNTLHKAEIKYYVNTNINKLFEEYEENKIYLTVAANQNTINKFKEVHNLFNKMEALANKINKESAINTEIFGYKGTMVIFIKEPSFELIFSNYIEIFLLHCTMMEPYLPTYCEDVELFYRAILKGDAIKASEIIDGILNDNELKENYFKKYLNNFKDVSEYLIDRAKNKKRNAETHMRSYADSYLEHKVLLKEALTEIETLKNAPLTDKHNILEYLTKQPYITKITPRESFLDFLDITYEAPILFIDRAVLKDRLEKERYENHLEPVVKVLANEQYELWTYCTISFNTKDFTVETTTTYNNNPNFIGHPHIDTWNCLGTHDTAIEEWGENQDYIGALTQISAAVLNLNVYDGTVMDDLLEKLYSLDLKETFKNTATGEFMNLQEIIKREGYQCNY